MRNPERWHGGPAEAGSTSIGEGRRRSLAEREIESMERRASEARSNEKLHKNYQRAFDIIAFGALLTPAKGVALPAFVAARCEEALSDEYKEQAENAEEAVKEANKQTEQEKAVAKHSRNPEKDKERQSSNFERRLDRVMRDHMEKFDLRGYRDLPSGRRV